MNTIIALSKEDLKELIQELVTQIREQKPNATFRWIDAEEAQKRLGIKRTALYELRAKGAITYSQPNRKVILYDSESIDQYLLLHRKNSF